MAECFHGNELFDLNKHFNHCTITHLEKRCCFSMNYEEYTSKVHI